MSPSMGKAVDDIEMGRKTVWADMGSTALDPSEGQLNERVAVKDGEFGELSPEIRTTVDETSDRAGIHPRRSSWGRKIVYLCIFLSITKRKILKRTCKGETREGKLTY